MADNDIRFVRLLAYLLLPEIDVETGYAIVDRGVLAWAAEQPADRRFNSEMFLNEFCMQLNLDYSADVIEYEMKGNVKQGRCRRLNIDFLGELWQLRWKEITPDIRKTWVHVVSGEPWIETAYKHERVYPTSANQGLIMRHMNSNQAEIYETTQNNLDSLKAIIALVPDEHERRLAERRLIEVRLSPPHYTPSKNRNTDRMFATGYSEMKGDHKRLLYDRWIELDLQCCHLHALSRTLELNGVKGGPQHRRLQSVLISSYPWAFAASDLYAPQLNNKTLHLSKRGMEPIEAPAITGEIRSNHQDTGSPNFDLTKADLKTVSYAILNGMRSGISPFCKGGIVKHGAELGWSAEKIKAVIEHPFVADILGLSNKLISHIKKHRWLLDANGTKHRLSDFNNKPTTLMAKVFSTYELALLAPIFERFHEFPGARVEAHIPTFEHDGITVMHDDPERVTDFITWCQSQVERRANELGMTVKLVRKTYVIEKAAEPEAIVREWRENDELNWYFER